MARQLMLAVVVVLGACAPAPVITPRIADTRPLLVAGDGPVEPPPETVEQVEPIPLPNRALGPPAAGQLNAYGLPVGPDLAAAYAALFAHRPADGLAALERAESTRQLGILWQVSMLRAQTMALAGRFHDAEAETEVTARREHAWLGHDLNAIAVRGDIRFAMGDFAGAVDDYTDVARRSRAWRLPIRYNAPPSNLAEVVALTTAQLRAYAGLARHHFRAGGYLTAARWATAAEERFNDVHYVASRLFDQNVPVHVDSFLDRADNLAVRGAARVAAGIGRDAGERDLAAATGFYAVLGDDGAALRALGLKVRALLAADDPTAALSALGAAAVLDAARFPDLAWRLDVLRGTGLRRLARFGEAAAALDRAAATADALAGGVAAVPAAWAMGVAGDDLVYEQAQLLLLRGDSAALFSALERARARSEVALARGLRFDDPARSPAIAALAELRRLETAVRAARLAQLAPGAAASGSAVAADLSAVRARLADARARVDAIAPALADLVAVRAASLARVQASLDADEAIAYTLPARAGDLLTWLMIRADRVRVFAVALSVAALEARLAEFADAVRHDDAAAQVGVAARLAAGLETRRLTEGLARLYLVPDGALDRVPWGGLDLAAPVVVLPRAGDRIADTPRFTAAGAVVVGYPAAAASTARAEALRAEADAMAQAFGVVPRLDRAATLAAVRAAVGGGADLLHLAAPCRITPARPLDAAITLAGRRPRAPVPLTARALTLAPVPARRVVLSSCTAAGETDAGTEAAVGAGSGAAAGAGAALLRAFLRGGTKSILMTLWPPRPADGGAAYLRAFFRATLTHDWGGAWMQARELARDRNLPPSVYGAFVLVGSADG